MIARAFADVVRTACVLVALATSAALLVETRRRLVEIDATRAPSPPQPQWYAAPPGPAYGYAPPPPPAEPRPLARLGRAGLELGEAVIGIVR